MGTVLPGTLTQTSSAIDTSTAAAGFDRWTDIEDASWLSFACHISHHDTRGIYLSVGFYGGWSHAADFLSDSLVQLDAWNSLCLLQPDQRQCSMCCIPSR